MNQPYSNILSQTPINTRRISIQDILKDEQQHELSPFSLISPYQKSYKQHIQKIIEDENVPQTTRFSDLKPEIRESKFHSPGVFTRDSGEKKLTTSNYMTRGTELQKYKKQSAKKRESKPTLSLQKNYQSQTCFIGAPEPTPTYENEWNVRYPVEQMNQLSNKQILKDYKFPQILDVMDHPDIWIDIRFVVSELKVMRRQVHQELVSTIEENSQNILFKNLKIKNNDLKQRNTLFEMQKELKKSIHEYNLESNDTLDESMPNTDQIKHLKIQKLVVRKTEKQGLTRNSSNLTTKNDNFELDDYLNKIQMQMSQNKTFQGVVVLKNSNYHELLINIENQKIYFYGPEKRQLFEKIKNRLDRQFYQDIPNTEIVKKLSKKLQILQNCYDGIICLNSPGYKFQCYLQWVYEDSYWRKQNKVIKLNISLQIEQSGQSSFIFGANSYPQQTLYMGGRRQINFQSYYDITNPQTFALIDALNYNLTSAQKSLTALNDPLFLRQSSICFKNGRLHLDQLVDKINFQAHFQITNDRPLWGQKMRITNQQFLAQVQTGDILLFTSKSMTSKMQRMFTGSQYDHIGMMIKYPKTGHLQIFESLTSTGVSKWNWNNFVEEKQYKNYEKIAFRKLNLFGKTEFVENREQLDRIVFNYVAQTVGNPFRLSLNRISQKLDTQNVDFQEISSDQGFFCSELIACLYKRLGLLPRDKSASQYWPGSFSTESLPDPDNDFQLVLEGDGNELSEEYILQFH